MSKNKYINPIAKVDKVSISTWEYAALIRASTLLEIVEKVVNGGVAEYQVKDILKALLFDDVKEGEEE